MAWTRSIRWYLLALLICGVGAQAQQPGQIPPGTIRTGQFMWDGARWLPVEAPPPPAPVAAVLTVSLAPPAMPVYVQPPCPAPNLIWTPGYWHWGLGGFYWVPGAWVPAPYGGALWTPGYWGWSGGQYIFHEGYWGPHVGFYGGVNYGGGYMGIGFAGGAWNGGVFAYNTAVVHVNATVVTNVYVNRTIVEQTTIVNTTNVSYNGGPNGVQHQPTPEEQAAASEPHTAPTTFQQQHVTTARSNPSSFAKNNGGHPTNLAETKPLPQEAHAPPAGFKPPPPRPLTELAKAQAPPATVAAAKTATAKNSTIKPPPPAAAPKTEAATAPRTEPGPATTAPKPEPKAETTMAPKPGPKPEAATAPKPEPKPATAAPPKPAPKAETKPAPKPKPKPGEKPQ